MAQTKKNPVLFARTLPSVGISGITFGPIDLSSDFIREIWEKQKIKEDKKVILARILESNLYD